LREEQLKDRHIQDLWKIAKGEYVRRETGRDYQDAENLRKIDGIIVKDEKRCTGEWQVRFVVPITLQHRVVEEAHNRSHAGVYGTTTPAENNCNNAKHNVFVSYGMLKLYAAPHITIVIFSYGMQYIKDNSNEYALVQSWISENGMI